MAHDHERFKEIQEMSVAELIHTMLSEYERPTDAYNKFPAWQSQDYFWAYERLEQVLPKETTHVAV